MNPILKDFPEEFSTERLLIRMPRPGDGKAVYDAIMASINELKHWMPFAQKEQSEQDVELNIRSSYISFLKREDLRLLVFLKETGEFVASSGLHRINWSIPKFEIGYWIDSRFSGKGYMTEAVKGISDFAFQELNAQRLEIRCDAINFKSRAIPERLGFSLEGILKNHDLSVDTKELRDTCIYAKTI
ncbi:GNAT family N-acetyltransferase [Neobacillus massiliamazoniensis]|uniref:Ribosomal-protein-serine acetyltransferase n=1 Tax=Neobacillus massiliamazoniensis TaxID=1499688 RepID=A0A0U1P430_9BACI|nr:GNAT family N-acetyltransferase [Neobacillus massiliamazoniensis]CRK85027.1 ribosomal-protein-serine acetyltransferase [Neobacillus massiliamazoniensis]